MSQRILLVDHDTDNAERKRSVLAAAGFEVVVAHAAEQGLTLFQAHHPELTVIEANLPGKPGADLCREIKQSEAGAELPVVIVNDSDNAEPDWIAALAQSGCDQLVERSVDDEDFLELCRGLMPQATAAPVETTEEPENATPPKPANEQEPAAQAQGPARDDVEAPLLDQDEVGDALGRFSSIMEESSEEPAATPQTQSGDFSHILEEEMNRDLPSREAVAQATAARPSAEVLPAQRDASPTPETATASVATDEGEDISAYLDHLFAGDTEDTAEAEQPKTAPAVVAQAAPTPPKTDGQPGSAPASPPVPERPRATTMAGGSPPATAPPDVPPVDEPVAGSTAAVKRITKPVPPVAVWKTTDLPLEEEEDKGRGGRFWLVAACVGLLLLGAGFVILGRRGESTPKATNAPPVAETLPARTAPAQKGPAGLAATPPPSSGGETDGAGESLVASLGPSSAAPQPAAPDAAPEGKPVTTKTPEPRRPAPAKAVTPANPEAPKTVPTKVASAPAREERKVAVEPVEAETPKPVAKSPVRKERSQPAAPIVEPPVREERSAPQPVESVSQKAPADPEPEPMVASPTPAPARATEQPLPADPPRPVEPVLTPPELIERIEATYPPKARKRGETGTVVLNVLVSETGRIIRVVVEEGVPGSELESAAVSAVLRWRYRPATEDGHPVRAWATARFVFE